MGQTVSLRGTAGSSDMLGDPTWLIPSCTDRHELVQAPLLISIILHKAPYDPHAVVCVLQRGGEMRSGTSRRRCTMRSCAALTARHLPVSSASAAPLKHLRTPTIRELVE